MGPRTENNSPRVVIVTGASSGIGLAVARRFGLAGDRILITARSDEGLAEAVGQLTAEGIEVVGQRADVRILEDVRVSVGRAIEDLGPIDVLVNNAGIGLEAPLVDLDESSWRSQLDTNLRGAFLMSREVGMAMVEAGRGGVILMTSSINSELVEPEVGAYSASKAGLDALTRGLALELAPHGIRVCSVRPGYINTPMVDKFYPDPIQRAEYVQRLAGPVPAGRFGDPGEVAAAFFFLASSDASYITGTTLTVDGGRMAKQ